MYTTYRTYRSHTLYRLFTFYVIGAANLNSLINLIFKRIEAMIDWMTRLEDSDHTHTSKMQDITI